MCKQFSEINRMFVKISQTNISENMTEDISPRLNLVDLNTEDALETLHKAEQLKQLIVPAKWILFYQENDEQTVDFSQRNSNNSGFTKAKRNVEDILRSVNIAINTEVYIVFVLKTQLVVTLVYRIRRDMPIIWEDYGRWDPLRGFDKPSPSEVVAMRRRDLKGLLVKTTTVISNNDTLKHMPNYLFKEVDTLSKILYYMSIHLFEWMNGTGFFNTSTSWGYLKPDGTYDGIVRELWEGRSDFSGSVLIPMESRLKATQYVLPPAPIDVRFVFRKPSLASVTNIYSLPFSSSVWTSIVLLIIISSFALFLTSYREVNVNPRFSKKLTHRVLQSFHDTLCLVFQQGSAEDPVSFSSREILMLGLLAFMFLYTAYSANVVALLQSATNDINSVEAMTNSPLQCAAQDVVYNREIFANEKRPTHRAFWLKKGLPQGEKFFLSVEEGIRRVRQGMFAYQVEPTAGFEQIKKTFLEHEKCNIGTVKYTEFLYPYVGIAKNTPIKEALKIGVIRIIEGGIQSRSTRRLASPLTACGTGAAMFTAVGLQDVAGAFTCMMLLYGLALAILGLEIVVRRAGLHQQNKRVTSQDSQEL